MVSYAFPRTTAVRWLALPLMALSVACRGESITSRDPDSVFGNAVVAVK